ncbi:MAG: non-homologous end-joining DNA ligase [Devosia sp.]
MKASTMDLRNGAAIAEKAGIELTHPDRAVYREPEITKAELAAYYAAVADRMLPFIAGRPLSLLRCPQGQAHYCFFQKHDTGGFPASMKSVKITEKDGAVEDYFYIEDVAGLIGGVQMNVLEFHLWGAKRDDIEKPERIIFDIDPDEGLGFAHVRDAAADIRKALGDLGLDSFAMLTGGKGVHVIAPLQPSLEWPEVKAFCHGFAQKLEAAEPDRFITNMAKAKRKGRMFVDYLRNERGATAVSPWSTRSREGAPAAVPISWSELKTIEAANAFPLPVAAARAAKPDPWKGYFTTKQTITASMLGAVKEGGDL